MELEAGTREALVTTIGIPRSAGPTTAFEIASRCLLCPRRRQTPSALRVYAGPSSGVQLAEGSPLPVSSDGLCGLVDVNLEPEGSGHRKVFRSTLSSSPVDALAEQVGVPGVAGVLLDHVGQQPAQAHPLLGRLLQSTAGQRLGQRVA